MRKALLVTILLTCLLNIQVHAENIFSKQLDFKEAILMALENNNEIRAMKNALSATERDIGISRSAFFPKVNVGEEFMSTTSPAWHLTLQLNQRTVPLSDITGAPGTLNNPGNITNFTTYGNVIVPLFGLTALYAYKMTKTQYSAQGYFYLRKQEDLIKNVSIAYIQIGAAQEYVLFAEQDSIDANEYLKIANFKYRNKSGLYSDVLSANTQVTEAEQKLITAKNNLDIAKRNLGFLLGLKKSVDISNVTPALSLNPIDYYKAFSVYRTDIKAMEINVKNAKLGIKMAYADWSPTMYGTASYSYWNADYPFAGQGNYVAGVFLNWNIFDGGKRIYEVKKAKDKTKEAEEYLEWLKKTVDFKIYEAYSRVEESNTNYKLAKDALYSAEEGRDLVLKRWQDAKTSFVDVLNAQTNLIKARENLVKKCNDLRTQLINLYHESGIIRQELALN